MKGKKAQEIHKNSHSAIAIMKEMGYTREIEHKGVERHEFDNCKRII